MKVIINTKVGGGGKKEVSKQNFTLLTEVFIPEKRFKFVTSLCPNYWDQQHQSCKVRKVGKRNAEFNGTFIVKVVDHISKLVFKQHLTIL